MTPLGWFADVDTEADGPYIWQPCFVADQGTVHSFAVWFKTKKECEDYIMDTILPITANGLIS